jgi:anti-sigma regulatory factor (Ser/Thr protein kinase)
MERPLMIPVTSLVFPVTESSQIGEARRAFMRLAAQSGLPEDHCARVGLIVTELGTNLCKHAKNGELLGRSLTAEGIAGLDIHSIDRGPGMHNLDLCRQDGFSTSGSSGIGLGSVQRLADTFHAYSLASVGTIITTSVVLSEPPPHGLELGMVIAPAPGETVCGDSAGVERRGRRLLFVLADGLGHGPEAAEASAEAVRVARLGAEDAPAVLMARMHDALRKTRGAAAAVVSIDPDAGRLAYCSVGNTSTLLVRPGGVQTLPTSNGIVGHVLPRLETVTFPWTGRDLLVMHSDGINTRDTAYQQPGLLMRPVKVIAGMVYGRQKRGRDDAAVLVARISTP